MITTNAFGAFLSVKVAQALLEFASRDKTRAIINGVFVESDNLCATDGHTAVRFHDKLNAPKKANRRIWSVEYVERAVKSARTDKGAVVLAWDAMLGTICPPLAQFEPKGTRITAGDDADSAIGINATYLARCEIVCKACKRDRDPANKDDRPEQPPAILECASSPLDPIRFSVGERSKRDGQYAHSAWVTIMPERY